MQKRNKIVLRKRIRNSSMINGFEKLANMKLPDPPKDIPVEEHRLVLTWSMDMTNVASRKAYKELVELFELPYKTNGAKRLYFLMHRTCWWDVLFEVYEL